LDTQLASDPTFKVVGTLLCRSTPGARALPCPVALGTVACPELPLLPLAAVVPGTKPAKRLPISTPRLHPSSSDILRSCSCLSKILKLCAKRASIEGPPWMILSLRKSGVDPHWMNPTIMAGRETVYV